MLNLNYEEHKHLPENSVGEKIRKLRLTHGLQCPDLAESINTQVHNIWEWESDANRPSAPVVKRMADYFNIPIEYFGDYYFEYFNNPLEKIERWFLINNISNIKAEDILNITDSTLWALRSKKYNMSYEVYIKLKKAGIF